MLAICSQASDQHKDVRTMPASSSMVLAVAVGLMVLMPVNYRAGTDQAHPHTTFQLWIDAATGQSHHHDEMDHQQRVADAVHAPADAATSPARQTNGHILLSAHDGHDPGTMDVAVILGDAPASQQPDTAEPVTSHRPLQHASVLDALGTLIALLSTGTIRRPLWASHRRLAGVVCLLDPPPPRLAPC